MIRSCQEFTHEYVNFVRLIKTVTEMVTGCLRGWKVATFALSD